MGPITEDEIMVFAQILCPEKIVEVKNQIGSGNSRIYYVLATNGTAYSLKYYPDLLLDLRPRLQTEVMACLFLENLKLTPKAVAHDKDLNLALFEWIEGEPPGTIENSHIDQALVFIEKLKEKGLPRTNEQDMMAAITSQQNNGTSLVDRFYQSSRGETQKSES